jgi:hypothetical protein
MTQDQNTKSRPSLLDQVSPHAEPTYIIKDTKKNLERGLRHYFERFPKQLIPFKMQELLQIVVGNIG